MLTPFSAILGVGEQWNRNSLKDLGDLFGQI